MRPHPLLALLWAPLGWGGPHAGTVALAAGVLSLAVGVHAAAQAAALRRLGIPVLGLRLLPTGPVAEPVLPRTLPGELLAGAAGPAANFLLGLLLLFAGFALREAGGPGWSDRLVAAGILTGGFALLHCLPVLPFEGGRVLRGTLARRLSFRRTTGLMVGLTLGVAALLARWGLEDRPLLLAAGAYLALAAGEEALGVFRRPDPDRMRVWDVAWTPLPQVTRGTGTPAVLELFLTSGCSSLPVVEHGEVVGVVEQETLLRRIAAHGGSLYAAEVMTPPPAPVSPGAPLRLALARMEGERCAWLPVVEAGALRGFLSRDRVLLALAHPEPPPARRELWSPPCSPESPAGPSAPAERPAS